MIVLTVENSRSKGNESYRLGYVLARYVVFGYSACSAHGVAQQDNHISFKKSEDI